MVRSSAAGRYFVGTASSPVVTVRVPERPVVGADPATLAALEIGADQYPNLVLSVPGAAAGWAARLHFGGPHLLGASFESAGQLVICPGGDFASPSCQTADVEASISRDPTPSQLLWSGDYAISVRGRDAGAPSWISFYGR